MSFQTFYGADVSQWQEDIDWSQAAPTKDFFWYKGGGGDDGLYVDSKASENLAGIIAANKPHGSYWFAGNTDPVNEAQFACNNVWIDLAIGAWAILDIERGSNGLPSPDWTKLFLDTATAILGFRPVVYMNQNTENSNDWSPVVNANYGLIIADYAVPPSGSVGLQHWPFYVAQQYTSTGSIAGISGNVDLDAAFLASMDDYDKYGRPTPITSPVLPPTPVITTPLPVDSTTIATPVDNPDESTTIPVVIKPTAPIPPTVTPTPPPSIPVVVTTAVNEVRQVIENIIERIMLTFVEAVGAYWAAVPDHTLNKGALIGVIGAGLSAVYNLAKHYITAGE